MAQAANDSMTVKDIFQEILFAVLVLVILGTVWGFGYYTGRTDQRAVSVCK